MWRESNEELWIKNEELKENAELKEIQNSEFRIQKNRRFFESVWQQKSLRGAAEAILKVNTGKMDCHVASLLAMTLN